MADAKMDKVKEEGNIVEKMFKAKDSIASEYNKSKSNVRTIEKESIKIEKATKQKEIEDEMAKERHQKTIKHSEQIITKFSKEAAKAEKKALSSIKVQQKAYVVGLITCYNAAEINQQRCKCLQEATSSIKSIECIITSVKDFWHAIDSNLQVPLHLSTENKTKWEKEQFEASKGVESFRKSFLQEYDAVNKVCEAVWREMHFNLQKIFQ